MTHAALAPTSPTLLGRLRITPHDPRAWSEFVHRYGPHILGWARSRKLQEADAQDVTQDVLARLTTAMKTFHYDPSRSFRGWLRTVTANAVRDALSDHRRRTLAAGETDTLDQIHSIEAREDLSARLERGFDLEIYERAVERVRLRLAPHTWQAFHMLVLEERSGAEVAEALGMSVAMTYIARHKVAGRLREEITRLEAE